MSSEATLAWSGTNIVNGAVVDPIGTVASATFSIRWVPWSSAVTSTLSARGLGTGGLIVTRPSIVDRPMAKLHRPPVPNEQAAPPFTDMLEATVS